MVRSRNPSSSSWRTVATPLGNAVLSSVADRSTVRVMAGRLLRPTTIAGPFRNTEFRKATLLPSADSKVAFLNFGRGGRGGGGGAGAVGWGGGGGGAGGAGARGQALWAVGELAWALTRAARRSPMDWVWPVAAWSRVARS